MDKKRRNHNIKESITELIYDLSKEYKVSIEYIKNIIHEEIL